MVSPIATKIFSVTIEWPPLATKHLSWQQRVQLIETTIFSVAIESPSLATKYLSWQ